MPTKRSHDSKGPYYKFGDHGHKYYYTAHNEPSRLAAKAKADLQGRAEHAHHGGSKLQSILFNTNIWNKTNALKWLKDNNYKHNDIRETKHELRFRQNPPDKKAHYFVKVLPNGVELVLEE